MIEITKLIELYINRKDKFKKADERLSRRQEYFKEIQLIEANKDLNSNEKRALLNSAAQKLTGSGLVTFEFADYYLRHPSFINFEIISPMVAFWDQMLIKTYDEKQKIIKLEINRVKYVKEIASALFSSLFMAIVIFIFVRNGNQIINYLSDNFYVSKSFLGLAYLLFILLLVGLFILFNFIFLTLSDLKRLVK
ncbi:hypothetical protein [Acinetobacter bereziniae]|uniref:hypothetical protein n=1 Tax=Acinetobacter bereziniae TaxID=106648 RepID=UPI000C2B73EF|nr:hypothetical protein [Acinetobacter bereziniae]ATZ63692.1 hypothetical protein BSR55_10175 [Acinetobacter bereziniae]MBJ8443837.1 hypothetical protein [Acinetobacter bereziniae]MBJ8452958.1 hypothetical protein [Acinetobacter bereziniae]MBJ8457127.1 hypothetical protein [Acinetobacter bereziniae]